LTSSIWARPLVGATMHRAAAVRSNEWRCIGPLLLLCIEYMVRLIMVAGI
jgi:hypothetical protein